jgi:Lon protease-like protein
MVLALPKVIPLFPLPDLVFFPHIALPLHIFEPRYRAMVRDALDGERIIGMILLQDGWEERYYDNSAPIHPVGCAGRITAVQQMEGGRFNITLFGLTRFSVRDQFSDAPYRQAWVEPFHDVEEPCPLPTELKCLRRVVHEPAFLNICCSELPFTPVEKQLFLEAATPVQQAKRLVEVLRFNIEALMRNSPSTKHVS